MIITLSEARHEVVVFEWAEEMTEQHAQDFCDVCNAVFDDYYSVPYIMSRFGVNIYGGGFICTVYRDGKPLAVLGGIRNDLDGRTAFQFEHFATLPEERKSGYNLDLIWCIFDEVGKRFPDALLFGFPTDYARKVYMAAGCASSILYKRAFCGLTKNFLESMPFIEDKYAEAFTLKKKRARILTIGGKCYAVLISLARKIIPAGFILGEVSSKFKGTVPSAGIFRMYRYYSATPGIFGSRHALRSITYSPGANSQENNPTPYYYKTCHNSSDFFGGGN